MSANEKYDTRSVMKTLQSCTIIHCSKIQLNGMGNGGLNQMNIFTNLTQESRYFSNSLNTVSLND